MDRKTVSFREQLEASLRKTLSRQKTFKPSEDGVAQTGSAQLVAGLSAEAQEEVKKSQRAELEALPDEYYGDDFSAVLFELQNLPPYFTKEDLDAVVEARAGVLETVSSTLTEHVMAKYDSFAAGVEEVRQVDEGLQAAYTDVRVLRSELAAAAAEVASNLAVAARQRRKQGYTDLLTTLAALQEAAQLHAAFLEAQASCEFAGAFWLAAQCARALEPVAALRVAGELGQSASLLYAGTIQHLEAALAAICADFRPEQYAKVLEGYVYLGELGSLGEEVLAAFVSAMSSAAVKVVRGIIVGRAGLEEHARATAIFGELVKLLPADLFRPCLAQVMMVVFDILASHLQMQRWHAERLADHHRDLRSLDAARAQLAEAAAQAQADIGDATGHAPPAASNGHLHLSSSNAGQDTALQHRSGTASASAASPAPENGAQSTGPELQNGAAEQSEAAAVVPPSPPSKLAPIRVRPERAELVAGATQKVLAAVAKHRRVASAGSSLDRLAHEQRLANGPARSSSFDDLRARLGAPDAAAASSPDSQGPHAAPVGLPEAEAGPPSALDMEAAMLEERAREAEAWGAALTGVSQSLTEGRRRLWEEAARKLGALLAAPAAFQGEHFLQVLDWTQTMLTVGEAFSGCESSALRDAIARQSGRFFQAFHAANVQALHAMLERELWQRLPVEAGSLPNLAHVLEGGAPSQGDPLSVSSFQFETNNFAAWVAHGNPWRRQVPGEDGGASPTRRSRPESDGDDDDDAPELYGESIDEDSQRVTIAADRTGSTSTSGRLPEEGPALTASGWRLLRWAADYGGLMRGQRSQAGHVFSGMAELFELYLLHAFHTFADVPLAELAQGGQPRQGGGDRIPVRLKNAILRILSRSLTKYRSYYLPQMPLPGQAGTAAAGSKPQAQPPPSAAHTALSHPGNMYGLQERKVAADSLRKLAAVFLDAGPALMEALASCTDIPDQHTPELFFQTVKAASDLVEVMFRTAARLNVPLAWLPERLAEGNFNLEEPPERASPWVGVLLSHLATFRQKLGTAASLTPQDVSLLWGAARAYVAEVLLEGIARAGVRSKCTTMGRSAMSLDLQAVQRGLQQLEPGPSEAVVDALRIVDAYIKAFYLPWGPELRRWAQTHPEYTRPQLLALVTCIAEANTLKRKDRAALLQQIEADLGEVRIGRT